MFQLCSVLYNFTVKVVRYDMADYPKMTGLKEGLVIGAGAGPWPFLNRNAEMMPNLFVKADGSILQETHISRTHDEDNSFSTIKLPKEETRYRAIKEDL